MTTTFILGALVGIFCYWLGFITAAFFTAKGKDDEK